MAVADQVEGHESRRRRQLLRLRLLALRQEGTPEPRQFSAEIRDAMNTIIAEAEAMIKSGDHPEPGAETFLWVRITRLAMAADQAVDAARAGDAPRLRARLRHLEILTSAIWDVLELPSDQRQGSNVLAGHRDRLKDLVPYWP